MITREELEAAITKVRGHVQDGDGVKIIEFLDGLPGRTNSMNRALLHEGLVWYYSVLEDAEEGEPNSALAGAKLFQVTELTRPERFRSLAFELVETYEALSQMTEDAYETWKDTEEARYAGWLGLAASTLLTAQSEEIGAVQIDETTVLCRNLIDPMYVEVYKILTLDEAYAS